MQLENMILEKKDHIAMVIINRPPANSWSVAAMNDFEKVLDDIEADKEVRVAVLTGAGEKCFSAGMDVTDAGNPEIGPKGEALWRRVDRFSKPIIAAINGHAFGGGLELAMSCHFRIMIDSPQAKIGLTELNLGIIPGWGGTQRLMRIVGKPVALEMILFSKRIDAAEAFRIALVNRIAPPESFMNEVMAFAGAIAERPPIAVRCVLNAMTAGMYEGIDAGLKKEREGSGMVAASKDAVEGFTAFFQKRPPVFMGE